MASPADMWSRSADLSEAPKQASTCSNAERLTPAQSPQTKLQTFTIHYDFFPQLARGCTAQLHSAVPMASVKRQVMLSLDLQDVWLR